MGRKIKILFIGQLDLVFVKNDLEMLQKHYNVKTLDFIVTRNDLRGTLKTIIKMLYGVLWSDLTFSWFAGYHAYWAVRLSKLFRKKSIVVVGGYEVAKVPEIGYGAMSNPKSTYIVEYTLDNADKILAVSKFNEYEILKYTTSNNVELIYNGVDCNKFKPSGEKEDLIITIGRSIKSTYKLKGIDTFVKASLAFPDIRFIVIGTHDEETYSKLKKINHAVEFAGELSQEDVLMYLQKAKVYCQLSLRESFGMALAESMCCECVPVVTNNSALPEVVGNTGFYVPYDHPEVTSKAIKEALKSDKGIEARSRIMNLFTQEKREKHLKNVIENLLYVLFFV